MNAALTTVLTIIVLVSVIGGVLILRESFKRDRFAKKHEQKEDLWKKK